MWLLSLTAFFILVWTTSAHVHYVKPYNDFLDCPGQPCLTLDQYTSQSSTYFTPGATFILLAGNHSLQTTIYMINMSHITLKAQDSRSDAVITLLNGSAIQCESVTNLTIEGLTFLLYEVSEEFSAVVHISHSKAVWFLNLKFLGNNRDKTLARALYSVASTFTFVSCLFEENAGHYGGAMHAKNGSDITINSSVFIHNKAHYQGGAIYLENSALVLNGNIFMGNRVKALDGDPSPLLLVTYEGGAIYAQESVVIINGQPCSSRQLGCYKMNTTDHVASKEFPQNESFCTAGAACFISNQANTSGGAIYTQNSELTFGGITIVFRNNSAHARGGAMSIEKSNVTIYAQFLYYVSNKARMLGGAISASGSSLISKSVSSKQSILFITNSARLGGALRIIMPFRLKFDVIASLGNSSFIENTASFGGALHVANTRLILSGTILFKNNRARRRGGAISLFDSNTTMNGILTKFEGNSAEDGGALYCSKSQLMVNNIESLNFVANIAQRKGGGIHIHSSYEVVISAAEFANNTASECGGAVYIETSARVHLQNIIATGNSESAFCLLESKENFSGTTLISNNTGRLGGGISLTKGNSTLAFSDYTRFDRNRADAGGAVYSVYEMTLISLDGYALFTHNTADTDGGALYASGATVTFKDRSRITFQYNSAENGGAMYLAGSTFLVFDKTLTLHSSHNHAFKYGGGIYHEDAIVPIQCHFKKDQEDTTRLPFCFIKFTEIFESIYMAKLNAMVDSYNDSAACDGNFMFGGLLDRCQLVLKAKLLIADKRSIIPYKLLDNEFFVIEDGNSNNSEALTITSQPYQLCFCDQADVCSSVQSVEVYRGQTFILSLVAYDQMRRPISTHISSKISPSARLKLNQSSQALSLPCSLISYNLYSTADHEELILYPDGPCRDTGVARAVISVTLLPCPDGFNKSNEQCVCEERLRECGAVCTIDGDVTIMRRVGSRLWMSALYENGTYQGQILCKTCPADYCKMESVAIALQNPDVQCDLNHSRVLCGACATNYSLMFGGSRCEECSNTYLTLLLPFAAAGVALVVFLSVLRLTVATGMINSIILYANIVQANRKLFLPTNTKNVLTTFISWMNLDLGFETCFYDGMTAYAQSCLQFLCLDSNKPDHIH